MGSYHTKAEIGHAETVRKPNFPVSRWLPRLWGSEYSLLTWYLIDWADKIGGICRNARERTRCYRNGICRIPIFAVFPHAREITDSGNGDDILMNGEFVTVFGCGKGRTPEFRTVGRVCVDMAIQNTDSWIAHYPRSMTVVPATARFDIVQYMDYNC